MNFISPNFKRQGLSSERGSILIYTILVIISIMITAITMVKLLVPKLRVASESVSSLVALYAADSAMEWCLLSNRDQPGPPNVPSQPTISINAGVTYQIYTGSSITICPAGAALNYRTVGNYRGISRSLEVTQ